MRRGLRDATYNRPYPIRLESWTVCRRHYKGGMFSQVVNKDPIVGLARGQFNKTFTSYLQQQSFKEHTYLVTNDQHVRLSFQFLETKRISLNELGINTTFSLFFLLFFLSPVSRMVIKNTYVLCLTQDCKLHRDQKNSNHYFARCSWTKTPRKVVLLEWLYI